MLQCVGINYRHEDLVLIRKCFLNFKIFFTARRYASAVYAVVVYPSLCRSVCLSQAGVVSKRLDKSSWFLAWRLPSTYPTLCYKVICVSSELEYFSFVRYSGFRQFRHGKLIALSTNSSSSSSTVEFVDDTYIRQLTSRGCLLQIGQL